MAFVKKMMGFPLRISSHFRPSSHSKDMRKYVSHFLQGLLIIVQLAEGFIGGKDTGVKLDVDHCMDFAWKAKDTDKLHLRIEWLQIALQKAEESNDPKAVHWKVNIESELQEAIRAVNQNII